MFSNLETSTQINLIASGIIAFFIGFILHEVAHGKEALRNGDPTAKINGRLSLNPIKHLSLTWSFIIPAVMIALKFPFILLGGKPVPVNMMLVHLKNGYNGELKVAFAGIKINLTIAFITFIVLSIINMFGIKYDPNNFLLNFLNMSLIINLVLAFFNLIPIPPLDGGQALIAYLSKTHKLLFVRDFLEKINNFYGILILISLMLLKVLFIFLIIPFGVLNFVSPDFYSFLIENFK